MRVLSLDLRITAVRSLLNPHLGPMSEEQFVCGNELSTGQIIIVVLPLSMII